MRKVLKESNPRKAMEASLEFAEVLGLLDSELRKLIDLYRKERAMARSCSGGRFSPSPATRKGSREFSAKLWEGECC
jgi:hypothetical protein